MGKDGGFMTAKAISKRIKAKGLGRLRWYCQMCEKQCRDENGFKNHTQSASHLRQLDLFSENPEKYLTEFSDRFRREFLQTLRQRYGTSFVHVNTAYQFYIKDKEHLHMNATKWTTLSDFVTELGRDGICIVQERDDGFWIAYVDRDVAEKDKLAQEAGAEILLEERRAERQLQRQILIASHVKPATDTVDEVGSAHAARAASALRIKVSRFRQRPAVANEGIQNALESIAQPIAEKTPAENAKRRRRRWDERPAETSENEVQAQPPSAESTAPVSQEGEAHRATADPLDESDVQPWIVPGIVVKIINKDLENGTFSSKKGEIVQVFDEYGARVRLLDTGVVLELDQDDLETVIPKPRGKVLILRGPQRGSVAAVKSINTDHYNVTVSISENGHQDLVLEYEAVSRLQSLDTGAK